MRLWIESDNDFIEQQSISKQVHVDIDLTNIFDKFLFKFIF